MKSQKKQWYPVQYADAWVIQDSPNYNGKDILSSDEVGAEDAEANAKLCANAPLLIEAIKKLTMMAKTSGGTSGADSGLMEAIGEAEAILQLTK